jgi:hypothetical protein
MWTDVFFESFLGTLEEAAIKASRWLKEMGDRLADWT